MPTTLFDLTGKVAIVSGAAQGMGRAIALALAEAGADLLLVDRNESGVARTAEEVRQLGRRALADSTDVSIPAQVIALFQKLDAEFGRIDFLANVANGRFGTPLRYFADAVFMLMIVVLTYLGIRECLSFMEFPRLSPTMRIPIWWVYLSMPVGLGLAGIRMIQKYVAPKSLPQPVMAPGSELP